MKKLISLVVFSILLVACMPIKPTSGNSRLTNGFEMQKGVVDFYVNDSVIQYFIKPLKFNGPSSQLYSDFTFRTGDLSDYINVNFSIFSKQKYAKEDIKTYFFTGELEDLKLMYVDKRKSNFESRFSGKITKNHFYNLTENQSWKIVDDKNNDSIVFKPARKTRNFQKKINNSLPHITLKL
jgi:CRISPR/Cas system-associated endoribonuclease Cas2